MNCPGCQQVLQPITVSKKQSSPLYQCRYCGSHLLTPGHIQLLSLKQIRQLDSITSKKPPTTHPQCPQCQLPLTPTSSTKATVYTCPDNHYQFFPPGQLLQFKLDLQHQSPSLKTVKVALPLVTFLLAITIIPLTLNGSLTSQDTRISADQILTQPLITSLTSDQVVISFSTTEALITNLQLQTPTQIQTYPISTTPQTNHVVTLSQLQPQTSYTFTIDSQTSIDQPLTTSSTYSFTTP